MTRPLPLLVTIVARLDGLEVRVRDMEGCYGETFYKLRRESFAGSIERGLILEHLGLRRATEAEIDAVLDEEG